jgi:glucose/arabinose dehydrogenase
MCELVSEGFGPAGGVRVRADTVVSGLEVPWAIAFLSRDAFLVTERPGRIRLVERGVLVRAPVATIPIGESSEGGLLGIALHPAFAQNRLLYVYVTRTHARGSENRVERWTLSPDHRSARLDRVILDGIAAAQFHDGGRIKFGPDGMLYVGTGDAKDPETSQDPASPNGKILRLTPDGQVPADNPFARLPAFILGVRNTEGFDFRDAGTLLVTDHGPSGELGRTGHDEVDVANKGTNLGWPAVYGCETKEGTREPSLTWKEAVPPGGAAIYTGSRIPEWTGSLIIGTLGSRHLHRVVFDANDARKVARHEVYFQNELGRIREVIMSPAGELYVTTSNCDGRGDCPGEKDKVLRISASAKSAGNSSH